ncbi:cyclic pyranopterin monophosphate synthase MoaC [Psychrosphaera sp. B3R10]|uniref:cyclic pyranopterin monophosphate synthase MoaC n=1 Tax=unclassified Psychrosphaera TaxID=2641570 RepID=UPI001C0A41D5|nr:MULTISPECIES: cyclic pyranopterin monophosphate synthase MoaC [unclassified Psychrosphaera]MBU2880512.1 cyclic pyranopterin monophosphate synthase MoaC [Psychrosphaera sp. I2R16]MBU2989604.1 cyclic pyranopterin monophosphate synthase MoaC [Psychrosphaera sp. B3R10]
MAKLSHVNEQGQASMVDVGDKKITNRIATAEGFIYINDEAMKQVIEHTNKKGDVISTARIAGIMGAKRCADLIPLCHTLLLTKIDVDFEVEEDKGRIKIVSLCKVKGNTGVEMEALTAINVAALTLFDMCKAVDQNMRIDGIRVTSKSGGKSPDWSVK